MKIRTRLILLLTVSVVLSVGALALWIRGELTPRYMEAQEEVLVDMAETLALAIAKQPSITGPSGEMIISAAAVRKILGGLKGLIIDAKIYEHHKTAIDIRIYVTDRAGIVLFDSDSDKAVGQNYRRWRDVWLTLNGKYGARVSAGDPAYPDGDTMYVAAPVTFRGDIIGVVSVGKPTESISAFRRHLLGSLAVVFVLIVAGAFALAYIVNVWISRPLRQLQDYAAAVTRNERVSLPSLGRTEVADVGRAMEDMRQALDGKTYVTQYVQALTHELKAPIASIRGATELLEEPLPEEQRRRFLDNIATQSKRMQGLIDRLLELAALEHRNQLEKAAEIFLGPLIDEVVSDLKPLTDARGIKVKILSDGSQSVLGDRFLVSKALTNILKNAIEFSPEESSITITVSTNGLTTVISVVDEGPGVPSFAMDKLTDRFYALAKPNGQKGSGLGLSFVKEITDLHGATLDIINNDGSGLTVSLSFPGTKAAWGSTASSKAA
jgi:two-component system sensor histidine kinase CreC